MVVDFYPIVIGNMITNLEFSGWYKKFDNLMKLIFLVVKEENRFLSPSSQKLINVVHQIRHF